MRRGTLRAVDALHRRDVVLVLRLEDILDVLLRVAVDDREPCALHLDHDLVALLEDMVLVNQVNVELGHPVRDERLRLLEALVVAAAEHLAGDHELVAAHARLVGVLVGVDVDELDDPVAVGPRGRGEEAREDLARDGHVRAERLGLPAEHVGPVVDEALVLGQPGEPAGVVRVGHLDRPPPVGHRARRVRDVAVELPVAFPGRRVEGELAAGVEVELALGRLLDRRPGGVRLPLVAPGLERLRLGEIERALALEVVGEPGGLNLLAEMLPRRLPEIDVPQLLARAAPAAVVPRADDQVIELPPVILLERLVDLHRAVEVLLVEPARDVERRDRRLLEVVRGRAPLPEAVEGRVLDEVLPRRQRRGEEVRERALLEVPLEGVVLVKLRLAPPLGALDADDVLVAVAQAEAALVEEVVAEPGVAHGRLRRERLERRVRLEQRHDRQPPRVGDPEDAHPAVVVPHVLDQPLDRVVGVGRLVDALLVLGEARGAVHDELPLGLVLPADVLEGEDVAVGDQFSVVAVEPLRAPAADAVGRP